MGAAGHAQVVPFSAGSTPAMSRNASGLLAVGPSGASFSQLAGNGIGGTHGLPVPEWRAAEAAADEEQRQAIRQVVFTCMACTAPQQCVQSHLESLRAVPAPPLLLQLPA